VVCFSYPEGSGIDGGKVVAQAGYLWVTTGMENETALTFCLANSIYPITRIRASWRKISIGDGGFS
jgi:hypothetical protein